MYQLSANQYKICSFSHKIGEINENVILRGHRQKSVPISTEIFLIKTAIKIGKMNITP